MERLMKDEKEGQKGFAEEFTFELGLKKGEQVFSKLKAKGRKRVTGKSRCEIVFCVQGTESGLVEMEVTVDKEGEGGREDPMRAEACQAAAS